MKAARPSQGEQKTRQKPKIGTEKVQTKNMKKIY